MGSFSDYLEDELLDHVFGKGSYAAPSIYVAFSTKDPLDDGSALAEPSGGGYSRVATVGDDWNAAAGGIIDNAGEITFNEATDDWGTITHFALMDAESGGNLLVHGILGASVSIGSGDTARLEASDLSVSLN